MKCELLLLLIHHYECFELSLVLRFFVFLIDDQDGDDVVRRRIRFSDSCVCLWRLLLVCFL